MRNKLYKLDKLNNLDTQGWDIDFGQLLTVKRDVHPYIFLTDSFYESPDRKFACLFYTINEYRMGAYEGLVGLFKNKSNPTILANPTNQWFDWHGDSSFFFSDNFLFLRKLAYNPTDNLFWIPFVIFDLENKSFGFIDFDFTSIYYSPVKINLTLYKFNLDKPNEHKNINLPNREGQTFDLTEIRFYSFDKLDRLTEIYFDEKKNNAC